MGSLYKSSVENLFVLILVGIFIHDMEETCKDIIDGICSWDKDGNYWRGHRHSWLWITWFNVVNLIYDLIHGKMKSDAEKQKLPVVLTMVGYLDKQRL